MNTCRLTKAREHIIKSLLLLNMLLFTTQFSISQYTKWHRDTTFNNIEFKKIRFRNDGNTSTYANGYLMQETIVDGYPCYKNITLDKNGRIKFFILSDDFSVAGNNFKKETQVIIRNNGDFLIHCLYTPIVQGYQIRRENYKRLFFMGSTNFQLFPNGKLKYFNPVDVIEIQNIWCKPSAVRGGVSLYESGKLKECTSAMDQNIDGTFVGKNYTLKFNEDGTLFYAKKEKIFD